MEELFKYLMEQSFPVVISIYLLTRFEIKIENLTSAIQDLQKEIKQSS